MTPHLDQLETRVRNVVQDDPEQGIFRCHRSMFTDPAFFELELKHIFEGNWLFMAHESQIPEPGDYFTLFMGRQPVIITRDKEGELHAMLNTCSHRGATLCRKRRGNKSTLTCPFHGWSFKNDGRLLKAKNEKTGAYPDGFKQDGSHDLKHLPRLENYRGFLFGSLSDDVMPLTEYLGETTKIIDNIVDQAPAGLEVLRGTSTYTFDGNWKLGAENGADGYHVSSVHWNYASTMERRNYDKGGTRAVDANGWSKSMGGFYSFDHGHMMLWTRLINPEVRPVYQHRDEIAAEFGEARGDAIVNQTRNLCLYPNLYLMDQFSTQLRTIRPLAVDKSEVTIVCFAPKGESDESRALRIRQYEDFFNVSGMGTPDDLEEFRACQHGYAAQTLEWNDLSRGAKQWIDGPDDNARAVDMKPLMSGASPEDEGLYVLHHKHWVEQMLRALARERSQLIATSTGDEEDAA